MQAEGFSPAGAVQHVIDQYSMASISIAVILARGQGPARLARAALVEPRREDRVVGQHALDIVVSARSLGHAQPCFGFGMPLHDCLLPALPTALTR
jgi:hypothetical protein